MEVGQQVLPDLSGIDRKIILFLAQGYEDDEIAMRAHVAPGAVTAAIRNFRKLVRHRLRCQEHNKITRLGMVLYTLQHVITEEEQEQWTAEADAAIKLLVKYGLLDENTLLVVESAADPDNFGLELAALVPIIGKYNPKMIQGIFRSLCQTLGCGPIRLRVHFYLLARRDERRRAAG